jgi:hypothetical protein
MRDNIEDSAIAVGDIHGCYIKFRELCHLVNFGAQDALVTVGDFLDRGPDSRKVAAFFRDLPNAFSVLGNHKRRVTEQVAEALAFDRRQALKAERYGIRTFMNNIGASRRKRGRVSTFHFWKSIDSHPLKILHKVESGDTTPYSAHLTLLYLRSDSLDSL